MSTRNLTMVVERDYASNDEGGFAQDPVGLAEKSHVNMYLHHDGYPEYSKDIWVSCYCQYSSRCVFVLKPDKIIEKYYHDMEYTKFAEGETRSNEISHFPTGYD